MTEKEIRTAQPDEIAEFLDKGRLVDQSHLRVALANALRRIAELTKRVENLEHASR
jgi:hypothetical protein